MQRYLVGGAVRDALLGLPVNDRDYVVTGATPEEMVRLGYQPVGRDFPVFLHPETHEEHALARTERKSGVGYHGFVVHADPSVTLEEDLARRDLTINAMAQDDAGNLIDPYGGAQDLKDGVLRHVSPAFVEDPVRILRVARFAARFGFTVHPDTLRLMRQMVAGGEADHLVAERVWAEFAKGLMERTPATMFGVLAQCGALERLLPEVAGQGGLAPAVLRELDAAAARGAALPVRAALLLTRRYRADACQPVERSALQSLCGRLRVPNDCAQLAQALLRCEEGVAQGGSLSAAGLWQVLQSADALRQPDRFEALLAACACRVRSPEPAAAFARLRAALAAAAGVNAGEAARQAAAPSDIPARVQSARIEAIARALGTDPGPDR